MQVLLDAQVLALACMTELLSGDQRRRYSDLIDSPFMPKLRAPVPLSHVDRPKKLPTAPQVQGVLSPNSSTVSTKHSAEAEATAVRQSVVLSAHTALIDALVPEH